MFALCMTRHAVCVFGKFSEGILRSESLPRAHYPKEVGVGVSEKKVDNIRWKEAIVKLNEGRSLFGPFNTWYRRYILSALLRIKENSIDIDIRQFCLTYCCNKLYYLKVHYIMGFYI